MEQIIKRKRGRPEKITPLKLTITELWKKHPAWTDAEIRGELERILPELTKENPEIRDAEDLPGVFSIADYRRDELTPRKREIAESGIDKPWHMGALKENPLHPEAILYIFKVNEWLSNNMPNEPQLTIRQAYWVAQHYAMVAYGDIRKIKPKAFEQIWITAYIYSYMEIISKLSGELEFDTTAIDKRCWYGGLEELGVEIMMAEPSILEKYKAKFNLIKDGGK